ncbi:murein L,D-transpeptidase YafK [Rhodoblastus sphagnicola]|uniref:L,D-transpeptidase family protein n=1 Tax=Rhodoblastus sphagnicola TaxID=333368 RepID=UPI0011B0EE44|nr:murein L,D-transpeptidase family protein [Rhodoblastus sphagnicola]MBB4196574.1 murein L,D-transpeptidase YafK [Rhodoblastus sphagnicola]
MTHRKWTRFLTLASASVTTLCLGAWLSYEAAIQSGSVAETRHSGNFSQARADIDLRAAEPAAIPAEPAAAQAAVPTGATLPAEPPAVESQAAVETAPDESVIRASLSVETRSLFADADPGAAALELRGAPVPDVPPLQPPSGAQAAVAPAEKPSPLDDFTLPQEILLPKLADRPVPVDGVPLPPRRPVGLAAVPAPAQVASLGPVTLPMTPGVAVAPQVVVSPQEPKSAPAAAASPAKAASAKTAAPQTAPAPAAAPSDNGFPNISNALAAVSASVGGANSTMTPQPEEVAPAFPEPTGGFKKGAQVFVRIFKREGSLELWMKKGDRFALYKNYPICKWSGKLGPKQAYADYQSPEGFYSVSSKQLNPHSAYHLAFDVGYPNAYDRRHGFTGNKIMVHGDCKSVGCFAMTNAGIDEIYGFVASALASGQSEVPVHIFPFRMTEEAIARENGGGNSFLAFLDNGGPRQDWSPFWHNLKEGYDLFERSHVPPTAYACGDRYEFSGSAGSCSRIAGR